MGSLNIQEKKTAKQQVADGGNAKRADLVDNNHVENETLESFLEEINRKNLPQTLPYSERKPNSKLWTINS